MRRFLLRRAVQAGIVLVGVAVITFSLLQLVPGDPVRTALGTRFDPETYAALRARAGLDQPLPVQLGDYLLSAVRGDLGVSFRSGQPVTILLLERLPATLTLGLAGLAVALVIALPLGILAAVRQGSKTDATATVVSQVGVSVPDFWMGILLILLFAGTLGWLPSAGYVSPTEDVGGWLSHLVLPAVTIGVVSGSILTRFVRSAVLESLGQDYTRTARSKGLPAGLVLRRHVLRNAMIPVLTITGLQLATLLGGLIVIEYVFAWPGLGQLVFTAVQGRDYPLVQGVVLLLAALFLLVNLLVDLSYAALDPRISYS
ncbi:MAG: ABC transporter permease [Actinomycetota bacterium]|nr:ABC transporter permease [Actinomycetota bacterium]